MGWVGSYKMTGQFAATNVGILNTSRHCQLDGTVPTTPILQKNYRLTNRFSFLQLHYWGPITYGPPQQILGAVPWPPGHPSIDADDREIRPVGLRFFDEQTATVVLLHYVPPTGRHQAMLRSARPSVCLSVACSELETLHSRVLVTAQH